MPRARRAGKHTVSFVGCRLTQETRVQNSWNDLAGHIWLSLNAAGGYSKERESGKLVITEEREVFGKRKRDDDDDNDGAASQAGRLLRTTSRTAIGA